MPEQLKIIIDADVNKAIAGVQALSKVIALDFAKATQAASVAATNLSSEVAASVQKINASLAGLKVTSLDVSVNTSTIDASIKSIQSKFNSLVDPQVNVFANTAQAEARIKELIADLATLKGSEIFIRANDTQALQKINEIETELNSLVGKQIDLKVTADLTKITELKAKLDSLKVTPVNVSVNTSGIDAQIKNIQTKFSALIDPQINVLANTAQAEVKVKELLAELSTLKGSEIFIRANDVQALKVINEVEAELKGILDKQIRLNIDSSKVISGIEQVKTEINSITGKAINLSVNTSTALEQINTLEKELLNLQTLSVSPNISSTQLSLFEANIKRIKGEIAALKGQGVVIPIEANTALAQRNINLLSETIETLRAKAEARKFFITTETDITKVAAYNKEIQKLEDEVRRLQNIGKKGFELFVVPGQTINSVKSLTSSVAAFGGGVKAFIPPAIAGFNKLPGSISPAIVQLKALERQAVTTGAATTNAFSKAFGGLRSLAALIPGIGLGGLIGLAATAVNNLTQGFFDAAFGASKLDKAIDGASESIDKNAASVIVMVRALQSGTLSSEEFRKIKAQLIAQAPEFQKSFDGDKISIEASELALQNYIKQLTTTVRVTAALAVVNDTLAKSIKSIVTGGKADNVGTKISEGLTQLGGLGLKASKVSEQNAKRLEEAFDIFKPENITKLIDDTFKKLGITFKDFGKTIDTNALEAALAKQKAAFDKFVNETIAKAQQFKKQFGDAFVLPELEVSFFTSKEQVFKNALKVLSDVKFDLRKRAALEKLEIKLPVIATTETKINADDLKKFLRGQITQDQIRTFKLTVPIVTDLDIQLAESLAKEFEPTKDLIDNFFKSVQLERNIPVYIKLDATLSKDSIDAINKKLNLSNQFAILGDLGSKEFSKIFKGIDTNNFAQLNAGIAEATKRLEGMMAIATTLNQAIGQGLTGAFNAAFDAVLEGKSVFKALAGAVKELIVSTIKAVAQMLILRLVTNAIFPGAGAAGGIGKLVGGLGGSANFGQLSGIGSRAFDNVIQINVNGQISGDTILLAGQRAANSQGRFG